MLRRAGALGLIVLTGAFVGCTEPQRAPNSPSTVEASTTTDPAATSTPDDHEVLTETVAFTSPSGNIGCYVNATQTRCDISEKTWSPPQRPADCEFDYGQGIALTAGAAAQFVCAGDTVLGSGAPLPLGRSVSVGTLRCESAESGVTCRDTTTGVASSSRASGMTSSEAVPAGGFVCPHPRRLMSSFATGDDLGRGARTWRSW